MRKAGIKDYETFAKEILKAIKGKPVSFEVFSDQFSQMERQALKIKGWQENVFVEIPITNSKGESSIPLIHALGRAGVQLNVTAILTLAQVRDVAAALNPSVPSVVSFFAGRIADTGRMRAVILFWRTCRKAKLLWSSASEILNIIQVDACGCVNPPLLEMRLQSTMK